MTELTVSTINIRTPKQVLHFSDGIMEIYDDEEETKTETKDEIPVIEKDLDWTPWFVYKTQRMGQNVINGLDYAGEKLATFLNITTPKYAYEIEQYRKDQVRKAREEQIEKDNTWKIQPESSEPITQPPSQFANMKF